MNIKPLHTFTNELDGMAAHVFAGVAGSFNVAIQDVDSGTYLPTKIVGIKSEGAAIAHAKRSINL